MNITKRMPKPMTSEELAQYRELRAELIVQAELIMSVFNPLNDREQVTGVEFEMGHPMGPQIEIWYDGYAYGEDYHEFFPCPESYLGMTEDELKAEKTRLKEDQRPRNTEGKYQRPKKENTIPKNLLEKCLNPRRENPDIRVLRKQKKK